MDQGEAEGAADDIVELACLYLQEKRYPSDCPATRKRQIRQRAKKFLIVDGELFYKQSADAKLVRYIQDRNEQRRVAKACHVDPTSGHMGVRKTIARVKERFMWKGVYKDVEVIVSTCDVCQRNNGKITTDTPALHPVPVHSPWHHVGIDFVGPISPVSSIGNKYILTLSDYFTKWVEAVPLPTKEAPGVAKTLYKIFLRMGFPKLLTSDQGGEFRSKLDKEMMKLLGIKRIHTTPYHPQANGLDERWNQTMKRMLVKFANENKDTWDEHLDHCVFAYNTSRHESSLFSPFEVMFGRKAIIPIELEFEKDGNKLLEEYLQEPTDDLVGQLTARRQNVLKEVASNIKLAQQKQKAVYDRKHANPSKFQVGVTVLKKDFNRKKRKGGKMDPQWLGPFKVAKDLGKGFYALEGIESDEIVTKRINGKHLKLYRTEVPTSSMDQSYYGDSEVLTNTDTTESCQESLLSPLLQRARKPFLPPLENSCSETETEHDSLEDSPPHLPPPLPEIWKPFSRLSKSKTASESSKNPLPPSPQALQQSFLNNTILDCEETTHEDNLTPPFKTACVSSSISLWKAAAEPAILDIFYASSPIVQGGYLPEIFSTLTSKALSPIKLASPATTQLQVATSPPLPSAARATTSGSSSQTTAAKATRAGSSSQTTAAKATKAGSSSSQTTATKAGSSSLSADTKPIGTGDRTVRSTSAVKKIALQHRKRLRQQIENDEGAIDVDTISLKPSKKLKQWTSTLSVEEERLLLGGGWLNDHLIDAAQQLMKAAHPQVKGFQNTFLGKVLAFDVMRGEFVQILHTGGGHWICISTIGCGEAEVDVFDSMTPGLTNATEEQIASLLVTNKDAITVTYRQCQQQAGSDDCGMFAIAFASILAAGGHPSAYLFNQKAMRQHLHTCISNGKLSPFPTMKNGRQNKSKARFTKQVEVYCNCRMPKSFSAEMVQCRVCKTWYHLDKCVFGVDKTKKWHCRDCNSFK